MTPGLVELEADLAAMYQEGFKYETPNMVMADRAIQIQQLRLLDTCIKGIVMCINRLAAIEAKLAAKEAAQLNVTFGQPGPKT